MRKNDLRIYLIFAIIIFFLFPIISGTDSYFLVVMIFVGIKILVTLGLTILLGFAGQLCLAQAAFYGIGAYSTGVLSAKYGISPWISVVFALFLAGLFAFIIGLPALKLKGHYLAMATLGFGMIINVIFKEWGSHTGGPSGLVNIPRLSFGSFVLETDFSYYLLVWIIVFLAIAFLLNIANSRIGRALLALKSKEDAARSMGIPVERYKITVFIFSGVIAALGGTLYSHYVTVISPECFDVFNSIVFVTMVVAGGATNIYGAVVGTFLFVVLPEFLQAFEDYSVIIYGFVLLIVLMFMPQGIVGTLGSLLNSIEIRIQNLVKGRRNAKIFTRGK